MFIKPSLPLQRKAARYPGLVAILLRLEDDTRSFDYFICLFFIYSCSLFLSTTYNSPSSFRAVHMFYLTFVNKPYAEYFSSYP